MGSREGQRCQHSVRSRQRARGQTRRRMPMIHHLPCYSIPYLNLFTLHMVKKFKSTPQYHKIILNNSSGACQEVCGDLSIGQLTAAQEIGPLNLPHSVYGKLARIIVQRIIIDRVYTPSHRGTVFMFTYVHLTSISHPHVRTLYLHHK